MNNIQEDMLEQIQTMSDDLCKALAEYKDVITALSMSTQDQLDGQSLIIGLGLSLQLMLNGCNQLAEANAEENGMDKDILFPMFVSAMCIIAQSTAGADERNTVTKQ